MPTTQEIADFYRQNANNPEAIRAAMAQYGITPEQAAAATGASVDNFNFNNFGNKIYSTQQVKDFYANGGDDNRMAQELGITDPWQRREALLQARRIGGAPTGDAAVQRQFDLYRQYNPRGRYANDFAGWANDQGLHTIEAMRTGTYTGAAASPADWQPGGIYGPGTGHDYSFAQGRYGTGAHGTGDAWKPWTGTAGEGGGTQTSQPMQVTPNGALVYQGTGTSTAPLPGEAGWVPPPGNTPLVGALTAAANLVNQGQVYGTQTTPTQRPLDWSFGGQRFNTPVLDALYNAQQQRMTTPGPQFNFQAKPGALTQAIETQ